MLILSNRLESQYDTREVDLGKSCVDNIFVLRQLIEVREE